MSENVFEQGEYTERKKYSFKIEMGHGSDEVTFYCITSIGHIYYDVFWRVVMNFCVNKVLLTKSTIAFYFMT